MFRLLRYYAGEKFDKTQVKSLNISRISRWTNQLLYLSRKFFHLTVSLIFLSGLFFDRDFIWLSGWLMLCIFVILEVHTLSLCIITGIFLPLFLSPNEEPHLYHLAGVAAVGVGDSVAAIYGSLYGATKWPRGKKTVEGSAAMAASIVVFLVAARPLCSAPVPSYLAIIFAALILAAIEAFTVRIDNIALPIVGYLLLH
ncbi:phosphatidate cytidylyltransferase [Ancylostoma ceylanicum]|uniref:dolichol kinase n=1 Tax=Ancylostoma ceylanicum TaxID=53326 RepID=A0A0D6LMY9_9BILA|nr:phosphatidate cytidylyltransferase [Ancylostoma ceylanicum]